MKEAFDIAVVGSGAAGIAAAVSAARAGAKTLLLDQHSAAGGTGGFSGLTTLCGLFDDQGKFLNEGFAREFAEALCAESLGAPASRVPFSASRRKSQNTNFPAPEILNNLSDESSGATPELTRGTRGLPIRPLRMGRVWVLPYRPEKFRAVAESFFSATPNLQTRWNTPLKNVLVENQRIISLNEFAVGAVIDCSGTAEVARLAGADCLVTDETTQAPAVVFSLQNVTREFSSPAAVAKVLLPLARAGFPPLNFQASLEPDTLTMKFTGRADQVFDVINFLRANVAGFENCVAAQGSSGTGILPVESVFKTGEGGQQKLDRQDACPTAFVATPRAGRMVIGEYILTGADVLAAKKFPDAVARCAWPVEQWSADGVVRYRFLPPGAHYEIPARSLRAAKIKNLFMAGKTISADADAIASARVMGGCLATGAAAGYLAARDLESTSK